MPFGTPPSFLVRSMSVSTTARARAEKREDDRQEDVESAGAALASAPLPPDKIIRTRKIWSKLLHAAALPLLVGVAILWLEGEFSGALFRRAWPVMALLAAAYVGAWVLSSRFERFPFVNQFEAALLSVSVTLVPAGLVFAARPGSAAAAGCARTHAPGSPR